VIGAGAAGMMCAAQAGQRGRRVALIDHVATIGEKIRISGGGRCNFTNVNASPSHYLSSDRSYAAEALSSYTAGEKMEIAKRYLVRRQLEANGLKAEQVEIEDAALRRIIDGYTREAGVRNLEREIGNVLRNVAVRIAEGTAQTIAIDAHDLHAILGARKFDAEVAMRSSVPGVATGLAWTPVGGDILFVEAARMPGSGKLILTGQLGDVMKESAQAALSLVKARAAQLGVAQALENSDIHIHVPAGATPKDGPSAGVAIFVALAFRTIAPSIFASWKSSGGV